MARVPVEVEYGSEFRYRQPLIFDDDVMIAISQSGETADTLAALKLDGTKPLGDLLPEIKRRPQAARKRD